MTCCIGADTVAQPDQKPLSFDEFQQYRQQKESERRSRFVGSKKKFEEHVSVRFCCSTVTND